MCLRISFQRGRELKFSSHSDDKNKFKIFVFVAVVLYFDSFERLKLFAKSKTQELSTQSACLTKNIPAYESNFNSLFFYIKQFKRIMVTKNIDPHYIQFKIKNTFKKLR